MATEITTPNGTLTVDDLIRQAQYALGAAYLLVSNRIGEPAATYFARQVRVAPELSDLLHQHRDSAAHRAARVGLGVLLRPQLARDAATTECAALLENSEALGETLADAKWEEAAEVISRDVIDAYIAALLAASEDVR